MKNRILILVFSLIVILVIGKYTFFNKKDTHSHEASVETLSEIVKDDESVPFVGYVPKNGKLEATTLDVVPSNDIYKTIVDTLLLEYDIFPKGYVSSSVERKNNLLTIKFKKDFKNLIPGEEALKKLYIMSIVNTLTEIKGIENVEIYSGREKLTIGKEDVFKRDTSIVNLENYDDPKKALEKQMKYEQDGDFLKSYLLMSTSQSSKKKIYYEYLAEMQEIKSLGFLGGNFKIKDVNVKGKNATLNVEFNNVSAKGETVNKSTLPIKAVLENGRWVVAWE